MGKRRNARQAAVQFHFWRDAHGGEAPEKMDEFWEFCPAKPSVREFAQPLIDGMMTHLPDVDDRIRRYTENYDIGRISPVGARDSSSSASYQASGGKPAFFRSCSTASSTRLCTRIRRIQAAVASVDGLRFMS